MMSTTQREANRETKVEHLVMLVSDSGQVMMVVFRDCWVAEVQRNGFGVESPKTRIKLL